MVEMGIVDLAPAADVVRQRTRAIDGPTFERMRERIEDGLTWGVGGLLTDEADRLLLVCEHGRWLLPGGGVEDGESHQAALTREIGEETGLAVSIGPVRAVTEQTVTHGTQQVTFNFAIYDATAETTRITDDPGLADESIVAVHWFDTLPSSTLDRGLIQDLR